MSPTLPRPTRPLPKLRPRPTPPVPAASAKPSSGQDRPAKDGVARGGWLLHIDGSSYQIEGSFRRDRQKRFVPVRPQDLQPVRSLITSGRAVIGALERLSRLGRRTHQLTPVLGLRLDRDGAVLLRELVLIG